MDLNVSTLIGEGSGLCARLIISGQAGDAQLVAALLSAINQLTKENQELADKLTEAEDKLAGATTRE